MTERPRPEASEAIQAHVTRFFNGGEGFYLGAWAREAVRLLHNARKELDALRQQLAEAQADIKVLTQSRDNLADRLAVAVELHAEAEAERERLKAGSMRFVWLMERYLSRDSADLRRIPAGTLVYWDGGHAERFTIDPWKAKQWATKEAAMKECPPEHYQQWGWRYVEHGFTESKLEKTVELFNGLTERIAKLEAFKQHCHEHHALPDICCPEI